HRARIVLDPRLRPLHCLLLQRRQVDLGCGLEMIELADDVVPRRRCLRAGGTCRKRQGETDRDKGEPGSAHQRYPASSTAFRQLLLMPLGVEIRQGTDLLVSLVEPPHTLTISRWQAFATVTRAATRFWMASKAAR